MRLPLLPKTRRAARATGVIACVTLLLLAVLSVAVMCVGPASASQHPGQTGEVLEQGGAYISRAEILDIKDGNAPWDADDAPGNDSSPTNLIIRTFDTVRYDVEYVVTPYDDAQYDYYKNTRIGFRVAIPLTNKQAAFDTNSMGWVDTTQGYEMSVTTETIGGQQWQVLTCYRRLIGTSSVPVVVPGTATVSFPITVKGMSHGDVLDPVVHVWVAGDEDLNEATYGDAHGYECDIPPVTVSATPRYNVRFVHSGEVSGRGEFDFTTGNEYAQNKEVGQIDGRYFAYGITLQLYNTSAQKRLMGVEFPDGSPITFDIDLQSTLAYTDANTLQRVNVDVTGNYTPLVWACDGENTASTKADGRVVTVFGNTRSSVHGGTTVYNKRGSWYNSAYDGGTWRVVQDGSTLHFTVSDYHMDPDNFPYAWSNYPTDLYPIYNPATGIQNVGCFSGCGLWVVQPLQDLVTGETPFDQYAIEDGGGTFTITARDYNLQATSLSGQSLAVVSDNANQGATWDDIPVVTKDIRLPGSFDTRCQYTFHDNTGAAEQGTDRKSYLYNYSDGTDSTTLGSKLRILCGFRVNPGDMDNQSVLSLTFLRFDDRHVSYDPTRGFGCCVGGALSKVTPYFVAKESHGGWDDDDEMRQATYGTEGLLFFDSYDELVEEEYTCVGVLLESRWAYTNEPLIYADLRYTVPITITSDEEKVGDVAMCTNEVSVWSRRTLADDVAAHQFKDVDDLTREDYQQYADDVFHTIDADRRFVGFATPATWHVNRGPAYTKAYYDSNGYAGGHIGAYQYGDSILILGELATISKSVAQRSGNAPKVIFDMDYQQRYVDYIFTMNVTDSLGGASETPTTLVIVDTLPSSLSYLPNSAYYGGTYAEHTPSPGTVEGGEALTPTVTRNGDGTTTLEFILPDVVPTELKPIHFSAQIGTPGNPDTDVENSQSITNEVTISSTLDRRKHKVEYGNQYSCTISVSKLRQQSLTIYADPLYNEQNSTLTMYSAIGNYGNTSLPRAIGINIMPWMGTDSGSDFHGTYAISGATLDLSRVTSPEEVTIWFTNDTRYRTDPYSTMGWTDVHNGWAQGSIDLTTGAITVPAGYESPTAWAICHTALPTSETLRVTMNLLPNGNAAGDAYRFTLTDTDNTVHSIVYVVTRSVSGVVWRDNDFDGVRTEGADDLLANVEVSLVSDTTGSVITNFDGDECKMTTGTDGHYLFQKVPPGDIHVRFRPLTGSWDAYEPTEKDSPRATEPTDSDADGVFESGLLRALSVGTIHMHAIADMATNVQSVDYQDAGIQLLNQPLLLHKMDYDDHTHPVGGATFTLSGTTVAGAHWEHEMESTLAGTLEIEHVPYGTYVLTETEPKPGYVPATGTWSITVDSSGVALSGDAEFTVGDDTILNMSYKHLAVTMPVTGHRGITLIWVTATALAVSGCLAWVVSGWDACRPHRDGSRRGRQ